jgi:DNA mismatch repair protein MutS|nr:DNA mismatch repair protein MutS [Kofleriaceae bacterium]
MRQYLDVKERYADALIFFRLGDFYEMFFEDAVVGARALDLTLTTRDKGKDDAVPMCGVPHHASRGYIARLTELGHKVVVVEQVEDPRLAKGLVKREVARIVTPGVVLDDDVLEPKRPRYVACVVTAKDACGLAYLDASTGELAATELPAGALADELARVAPRELLATAKELAGPLAPVRARVRGVAWTTYAALAPRASGLGQRSNEDGHAASGVATALAVDGALTGIAGSEAAPALAKRAAEVVVAYARATQPAGTLPIAALRVYAADDAVVLDEAAIANLELVETLIGKRKVGSLLDVIDATVTAPGGRLLRRWLTFPLRDVPQIRRRQDVVAWLVERPALADRIRRELGEIADLERLAGKATLGIATPRDLGRLRNALARLPELVGLVRSGADKLQPVPELLDGDRGLGACTRPELATLAARLARALADEPPAMLKDGAVIRTGYDATVDDCRRLADGGKDEILGIEEREQKGSGIANLKVRYNRVFGYYIEITKTHLAKVPAHYVRKQTIATGERYVTPELAELERKVLAAEDTLGAREAELFRAEVAAVAVVAASVSAAGAALAVLDACGSLADVAARRGYTRPLVDDGFALAITDGRHPVVESILPPGTFVPNDCRLDPDAEQVVLVTGPNMAGKSTYMRAVAQIALLAQIGSFVPAASATIGVCDRVFTRVGAADDLSRGDSTFMVEMRETASILAKATRRSLVVLDEVGRGTSTFDGVAIAWAVAEHIHDAIGARTLFATHYHELVALADSRPRVRNVHVAVREDDRKKEIVFLRRVVPGGASRSYGIDVARLAGLPKQVIARARGILGVLESGGSAAPRVDTRPPDDSRQLSLLAPVASPLATKLASIDVDNTTPLEALRLLAELKSLA